VYVRTKSRICVRCREAEAAGAAKPKAFECYIRADCICLAALVLCCSVCVAVCCSVCVLQCVCVAVYVLQLTVVLQCELQLHVVFAQTVSVLQHSSCVAVCVLQCVCVVKCVCCRVRVAVDSCVAV